MGRPRYENCSQLRQKWEYNKTTDTMEYKIKEAGDTSWSTLLTLDKAGGGAAALKVVGGTGTVAAGDIVVIEGWDTTYEVPTVLPADANRAAGLYEDLYFSPEAITAGEVGFVMKRGLLSAQNTSAASAAGQKVYLSETAGDWSLTAPTAGMQIEIGTVIVDSASVGRILFDLSGAEKSMDIGALANALAAAPAINDVLAVSDTSDTTEITTKKVTVLELMGALHNVTAMAAAPAIDDLMLVTDENVASDPARAITVLELLGAVHNVTALSASPATDDLMLVTDESTANDPARAITVAELFACGADLTAGTGSFGGGYGAGGVTISTDGKIQANAGFESDITGTVLNVTGVAAAASHVIDMVNAYTGMVIETGTYASAASNGVTLSATNPRPVSFVADDAGALLGASNYRGVVSRVYVAETQSGQIALKAIEGHLKVATAKNLTIGSSYMNAINAVNGYIELAGTHTIGATARVAGLHSLVEVTGNVTLTSGGYLAGVFAELAQVTASSVSGIGTAAFLVDRLHSDHSTHQAAWTTGLVIVASACATGISIAACTTGIVLSGVQTNAITIATTGSTAEDGHCLRIGTSATPITAGTTGMSAVKGYSDFSVNTGYHVGAWFTSMLTATTGDASVYALRGAAELPSGKTNTGGYIVGVHGRWRAGAGILDGASVGCGVLAQWLDGGTYTSVGNATALWVDCQNQQAVSAGTSSMVFISHNGSSTGAVDHCFYIIAGNRITNLFGINTASGMVTDGTANDIHGGAGKRIKINIDGTTYYLLASTTPA